MSDMRNFAANENGSAVQLVALLRTARPFTFAASVAPMTMACKVEARI